MQAFPDNTILVAQSLTAVAPMMELCDARRPIHHLSTILRIAGLTTRYWGWRKGEVCVCVCRAGFVRSESAQIANPCSAVGTSSGRHVVRGAFQALQPLAPRPH